MHSAPFTLLVAGVPGVQTDASGKMPPCEIILCAAPSSPFLRPLPLLPGRCSVPGSVRLCPQIVSTDNSGIRSPTPVRPHVRRATVRPESTGTPCPMSADPWVNSSPLHFPRSRGMPRNFVRRIAGRLRAIALHSNCFDLPAPLTYDGLIWRQVQATTSIRAVSSARTGYS